MTYLSVYRSLNPLKFTDPNYFKNYFCYQFVFCTLANVLSRINFRYHFTKLYFIKFLVRFIDLLIIHEKFIDFLQYFKYIEIILENKCNEQLCIVNCFYTNFVISKYFVYGYGWFLDLIFEKAVHFCQYQYHSEHKNILPKQIFGLYLWYTIILLRYILVS